MLKYQPLKKLYSYEPVAPFEESKKPLYSIEDKAKHITYYENVVLL